MTAIAGPAAGHDLVAATPGRLRGPAYDRERPAPAVVHFGLGGFHRAHQAVYFDELARTGAGGWGITGVCLRRRAVPDALSAQDGLYTVLSRDRDGERARVIGSLRRAWYAPDDPERVLGALADPRTELVTLTITGDGYAVDEASPAVRADLARPGRPATTWGYLVEALARRRAAGAGPFTVLSCDNIAGNGAAARAAVLAHARLRDDVLARWIERHAAFPSSMVDRITPVAGPVEQAHVAARLGYEDRCPVVTEDFSQWVVEDAFCGARPRLDAAGVTFVSDAAPHRLAKTRLLNGAHTALAYVGLLAGHRTTRDAMADPAVRAYVTRLMRDEVAPLLPAVAGLDLASYVRSLLRRLANPAMADPLSRLGARGSTKVPAYLLPSLLDALTRGRPHGALALGVAAWLRCLDGFGLQDAGAERLRALAGQDPRPLLAQAFGAAGRRPDVVAAVEGALRALAREGTMIETCARDLSLAA